MGDDDAITPRLCAACGGSAGFASAEAVCPWCTAGYQDEHQQRAWREFRHRMRRLSATYDFLEATVEHLLEELDAIQGSEELLAEGLVLLDAWKRGDIIQPQERSRSAAAEELSEWTRRAVAYLRRTK